MKIGVIGIGQIGGTIAKKLAKTGHMVKVANSKGIDSVADFAKEIGAIAADLQTVGVDTDVFGFVRANPKYCRFAQKFVGEFVA